MDLLPTFWVSFSFILVSYFEALKLVGAKISYTG